MTIGGVKLKNIDEEIVEIRKNIDFKRNLFNTLGGLLTQESIDVMTEEIRKLERKVAILEERKKIGIYVPKKPTLGDDRYRGFYDKEALDILRVLYYDFFHKDPKLSYVMNKAMFDDDTLDIMAQIYLVRGEFPFRLMLTTCYKDYSPNEERSVGIRFDRKDLSKECAKEYLSFMSELIKRYTNDEINFICGDAINKNCTLAYIGDGDFYHYPGVLKEKMYYDFFNLLCDNNYRNIIYIGDTMMQNARYEEIERVNSDFVIRDIKAIAGFLGMTTEQLIHTNDELKNQILTLRRSTNN